MPKKDWSFLHSGTTFLLSQSGSQVCRDFDVTWHLCGITAWMWWFVWFQVCLMSSLLGELTPWQRGGDWRWCSEWQILSYSCLCMAASRMEADAFCEDISYIATVSLQLVAVIELCTIAVNQLGMGFWNLLLGPKHSCCNRVILLTTVFLRVGKLRIEWNRFSPFYLCVTCEKGVILSREHGSKPAETQVKTFISFSGFWIGPLRTCFDQWRECTGQI